MRGLCLKLATAMCDPILQDWADDMAHSTDEANIDAVCVLCSR